MQFKEELYQWGQQSDSKNINKAKREKETSQRDRETYSERNRGCEMEGAAADM